MWKNHILKEKNKNYIYLSLIVLLTVLLYFTVLFNGFVWDDHIQILENTNISKLSLEHIGDIFVPSRTEKAVYAPVSELIGRFYYLLFNKEPLWYHFVNLIFYVLTLILIYLITLELFNNKEISFFGTVFFLINPLHVEVVAWIGCGSYVLSGLFLLISFYLFIIFNKETKFNYILFSFIFFVLSVLIHHFPIVYPLFMIFYIFCINNNNYKNITLYTFPFWLISFFDFYLSYKVGITSNRMGFEAQHTPLIQILNIIGKYFFNLFLPIDLCPKYHYPLSDHYSIIALIAISVITFIIIITKSKDFLFCWGWFFIYLIPYYNIIPLAWKMADRYLYFPSVGYSIFLGIAFKKFFDINKKYAIVTFAFLVIFYSAITFNLIGIWKNDLTLWSYAIKKSPESFFVIKNLAVSLYDRGRYDEAQKHLLKLINMKVGDSQVYSLNGSIEFNKGNYEGAVNYYKTANMIYPSSEDIRKSLAVSYYNLGIIYLNKKDLKKSMIYFKNAYDLDPNDKDVKKYIEVLKSEISEKGK